MKMGMASVMSRALNVEKEILGRVFMVERFEKFTFGISEISKYYSKIASDEMAKYNMKGPYAVYLVAMYRNPEGITAVRLGDICNKDKSEVSRAVSFMMKNDLVIREEVNRNSYRALLKLTDKGVEAATGIINRARLAVELGGEGISDSDREIFYNTLYAIAKNLRSLSENGLPDGSK